MTSPSKFVVFVDDNYHYMDESYRSTRGGFDTLEAAIAVCKQIVDASLEECHEPGMTAGELYGRYKMFGDDPFIRHESDPPFSAWKYAKERAEEICGGRDGDVE